MQNEMKNGRSLRAMAVCFGTKGVGQNKADSLSIHLKFNAFECVSFAENCGMRGIPQFPMNKIVSAAAADALLRDLIYSTNCAGFDYSLIHLE